MASGNKHDEAGAFIAVTTTVIASQLLPSSLTITYGLSSFAGFWLLSPDLDSNNFSSNPIHHWGRLKAFWRPYNKMVKPHRGPTHTPLIGAIWPLLWVQIFPLGLWIGLLLNGVSVPQFNSGEELMRLLVQGLAFEGVAYVAIAIQQLVHLKLDGILVERTVRLLKEER